jgi:acyl-coenzyme A synthetase/AMP-(fatty) acid ligase
MVVHTLAGLSGAIGGNAALDAGFVWSTFYDIRRYGGLQILLRAILSGGSLVMSNAGESTSEFLMRVARAGVTHISGTPSHWRRALMSAQAHAIEPRYVRLSGEIADQAILDHLRAFYPQATVAHAFASTEAGVAFEIRDGQAGFPASLLGQVNNGVELKVVDGSLRVRSPRVATRYLGPPTRELTDSDGFVDTGDEVELRGDRYYFAGRRDGVINVGGLKVHPEEVESVINRHEQVRMSLVKMRRNPITGGLVVADVVLRTPENGDSRGLAQEIMQLCRGALPPHKVPAAISFRTELPVTSNGKMVRQGA